MSIVLKIEAKLSAVNKRLEAAQRHIETIVDEKRKLDHAYSVVTELLEEEGNGMKGPKGPNNPSELTGPKLIVKILEETPRPLRPSEVSDIALKEYGREIPPASVSSALAYAKRSGRASNSEGTWSLIAVPQPGRPDPEERSAEDVS